MRFTISEYDLDDGETHEPPVKTMRTILNVSKRDCKKQKRADQAFSSQ